MKLEICVFSISDAISARDSGADRIELCASYIEGGITPSQATITETFKYIDPQQVVVMIRPRGGNFIYDDHEIEVMKEDIRNCKSLGAKNIIFGISETNGKLNRDQNKMLVELAADMHCTLQRAFDLAPDPFEALQTAKESGFKRILTSGQKPSAVEGKDIIRQLIQIADNKIDILPAAGINSKNAIELISYTNCTEIHASAKMTVDQSGDFRNGIYDFSHVVKVNPEEVAALKQITSAYPDW